MRKKAAAEAEAQAKAQAKKAEREAQKRKLLETFRRQQQQAGRRAVGPSDAHVNTSRGAAREEGDTAGVT